MLWNTVSRINIRTIWNRPVGRFNYGLWAAWYFLILADLMTGHIHRGFYVSAAVVYTAISPWAVNGRMLALGINRRWVIPYTLLLLGAALFVASNRWPAIAMAVYAAVTAPLLFLPSRRANGPRADAVV